MNTQYNFVRCLSRLRTWGPLCAAVVSVLLGPATAPAQPVPTKDTLLLAKFDRSVNADFSLGSPTPESRVPTTGLTAGRFGRGVDLQSGQRIRWAGNDGNFHPPEGTIEFWIKPHWPGNDPAKHSLFTCRFGERTYININSLGNGRLGIALAAGAGDDWTWRRADVDTGDWKPDQWHHLAFAWGKGQLHAYADGKEGPRRVTDATMPDKAPDSLFLLGGDAVIDAVRISKRMFTADDVRQSIQQALHPPYVFLSEMAWKSAGAATAGGRTRLGGIRLPLVLGNACYPKGLACRPGSKISFVLKEEFATLEAVVGVDGLSPPDAACSFEVWGGGKRLFDSGPRTAGQDPLPIRVPIAGVKELTLATRAVPESQRAGHCVWGSALVRRKEDPAPLLPSRPLKPASLAMYRRQQAADDYTFQPKTDAPYLVAAKFWEDDIDPSRAPETENLQGPLEAFATPGEYEPMNFVVYAVGDVPKLSVDVSELRFGDAVLPADRIDVRIVLRGLMRDLYPRPAEQSTVVSRFLLPYRPVDIPAGTLREYHVIVHVPYDAAAGKYTGRIRLTPAGGPARELPVVFEVLPFRFRPLTRKFYGIYYRFPRSEDDWPRTEIELADIRAHGGTMLKSGLSIEYETVDGRVRPVFTRLEHGLDLLRKHAFRGPMPVHTGCRHAARLVGYNPADDDADDQARGRFFQVVKQGMEGLAEIFKKYPQFEPLPTHMDEVFGRNRLDPYIRLTEAVRQVPSLRVYITLHNTPRPGIEEMMRRSDPYVDVRCYNGHAMDDWIRAGHTFEELRRQLDASGDEAWTYYNIRGSFFKAEWTRLVNGLYMWVSPLRAHVPWMYYSCSGNPLDETDGGHDFVYGIPDPADPTRMISTRHWEAYREGIDDMRYLSTLEDLIAECRGTPEAEKAQTWLDGLRADVTPKPAELESIEAESPILIQLSKKYDGAQYRRMRRQAAGHIQRLAAAGRPPKTAAENTSKSL